MASTGGGAEKPFLPGATVEGWEVRRVEALPWIRAVFHELRHGPTGARWIHIRRDDRENAFGVTFRTVPADSTGVAHILEHVVLCGSERYPVRDPFFAMLKRSLSTFMNAFTSADWTAYPFATQNRKDFANLLSVYLDAAFFPRLEELSFRQEGHRLEFEPDPAGGERLVFRGVVYNEMKGAMSSPDQVMVRRLQQALSPDTTYAHNSGGDPEEIPRLTWEGLREFHRRHYHPSNAFFYSYGDLPLEDHLAFVARQVLPRFAAAAPAPEVAPQPRWAAPRTAAAAYPIPPGEDPTKKHQACVAWLASDVRDTPEVLALALLDQVLLGTAAAPLRKALIDSGLGAALSDGSGYDPEPRDTRFAAGLKEVRAGDEEAVEGIVLDTLGRLAAEGIEPERIEAAIHQLEFHRREVTNTPYPYGLKLLLEIAGTWIHGGDPLRVLRFDEDLAAIRRGMERGRFFEDRIERWFLANPHRLRFALHPDPELAAREEEREQRRLAEIRRGLGPQEERRVREQAEALRRLQEAREDLSCLPTLGREDIPPDVPAVSPSRGNAALPLVCFEQPTSGIFYLAAAAGCGGVAAELEPLVPFFCHSFTRIGTRRRDYVAMARWIEAVTGGLGLSAAPHSAFRGAGEALALATLSGKALERNLAPMFDLLAELLAEYDFGDRFRLRNLLLEYRAGLEAGVVHQGHRLAISLAERNFSRTRALSEAWGGIHQLLEIKRLTEALDDERLDRLAAGLTRVGEALFRRPNLEVALIGEEAAVRAAEGAAAALLPALPGEGERRFRLEGAESRGPRLREGWSTATAVNFVAAALPVVRLAHEDAPALAVTAKLLRSLFLHREIREKGGAYSGFAVYNPEEGVFSLASYRDPNIVETLAVFEAAPDFLQSGEITENDIHEALLQVCADIDKPDPPGPAARKAFARRLVGLSDELRREFKARLLALDRRAVAAAAARWLPEKLQGASVAVIGSEESLEQANRRLAEPLALHRI
ncbi:MAG: insulinase family protein [Desulfobacterales bacterium]